MENKQMLIDLFGGRSIDTVNNSEIDKVLCRIDTMARSNLVGLYNFNSGGIETLFGVYLN